MQEGRVREKLESYTRGKNAATMLSDAIVTIRNDRYVIPVKSEYRSHYRGVIHDMSSSGQTFSSSRMQSCRPIMKLED